MQTKLKGEDCEETLEISSEKLKNEEAIKSLNAVLKWVPENNLQLTDIMTLQKLKEMAFENHQRNRQQ